MGTLPSSFGTTTTRTKNGALENTQVSVQHWKDGKIIREQFFYGN